MALFTIILTILGLSLFEIITSIDNAIINAEVLSTMEQKARRWFITWGMLFAVFVMRGLLPFAIVAATMPQLGVSGIFAQTLNQSPETAALIKESSGALLVAGGTFLIFLFFHWLFMEPKNFGLRGERFFQAQGAWFYAVISIILTFIVWYSLKINSAMALAAVVGSTGFFVVHGFQEFAEKQETKLSEKKGMSDISKILYLEVIDASFSIDGVVGAFAFTFAVPLIFLGNGLGAFALRQITVSNIERIKKYKYLKNGAMYSILFLGVVMVLHSFKSGIPSWISPIVTFATVGFFFIRSRKELNNLIS